LIYLNAPAEPGVLLTRASAEAILQLGVQTRIFHREHIDNLARLRLSCWGGRRGGLGLAHLWRGLVVTSEAIAPSGSTGIRQFERSLVRKMWKARSIAREISSLSSISQQELAGIATSAADPFNRTGISVFA
jgi:hypothetical protein